MLQTFFCTVVCSLGLLFPLVPAQSLSMTAPQPEHSVSMRVYLNPNTGRFWTTDTYKGDNEDPLSIHKYLYAHGNPVISSDPSGRAVWLVTRPLSIGGLSLLAPVAVHVFLAFDDNLSGSSGDPLPGWKSEVQNDNQNVGKIDPAVLAKWGSYQSDSHLTTLSFHPYSVAAGNGEKNQGGVFGTSGSCVAYNAPEDHDAFYNAGGNAWGYKRYWITGDLNEQMSPVTSKPASRGRIKTGHSEVTYSYRIF